MKVGFTGTRDGMTDIQKKLVRQLLLELEAEVIEHGDCLGSDSDAHDIAVEEKIKTVVHPPIKKDLRAFKKGDVIHPPKGYLPRDRNIVNATEALIGTPKSMTKKKGGTWYTIRFAIRMKKPVYIIGPNGELTIRGPIVETKIPGEGIDMILEQHKKDV